ncbi:hypothetical protein F1640_18380 [Novosphingobium sp. NBM11]|uniref:hypothetical protein n=1 Tax=Novosphingobium sp. NBM11 TaxID=2596914 RepID=UPI001892808E|nr:hypothetical protein [Novosphingobium sp. NBM11]MBF5091923.1 hypothetical protein [Novosphingobium sp. NBM11]
MMTDASSVTWGRVRDQVNEEIEGLKTLLVSADIDKVPALQAEIRALLSIVDWFEAGAPADKRIIGDANGY